LISGETYYFKVIVHNYNGPSPESEVASFPVCAAPSGLSQPTKVTTDLVTPSITVRWTQPSSNGGCAISGYYVEVDDGANGAFAEANIDNDPAVRNQPTIRELEITTVSTLGLTYRIRVTAINAAG